MAPSTRASLWPSRGQLDLARLELASADNSNTASTGLVIALLPLGVSRDDTISQAPSGLLGVSPPLSPDTAARLSCLNDAPSISDKQLVGARPYAALRSGAGSALSFAVTLYPGFSRAPRSPAACISALVCLRRNQTQARITSYPATSRTVCQGHLRSLGFRGALYPQSCAICAPLLQWTKKSARPCRRTPHRRRGKARPSRSPRIRRACSVLSRATSCQPNSPLVPPPYRQVTPPPPSCLPWPHDATRGVVTQSPCNSFVSCPSRIVNCFVSG